MKKYFRNVGIAVVACGLLFTVSACSDDKSQDAPPATESSEQSSNSQSAPASSPAPPQQSAATGAGGACGTLLTAKCTECHNLTRICEKLGKKSKSRWQRTIKRMTDRGAKLSSEESDTLLTCLDSNIKDLEALCQ